MMKPLRTALLGAAAILPAYGAMPALAQSQFMITPDNRYVQGVVAVDPTGKPLGGSASPLAVRPPSGTGAAASGTPVIATPGSYQTLFAAGTIVNGCYIQNPTTNSVDLLVDWTGATGSSIATTSQHVAPGSSVACAAAYGNAITVEAAAAISFVAGRF